MILPALLLAYLLGSIPFGLLLMKAAGLGDVRTIGSGNIGATNVLRAGNKKLAAATLLLDGGKGYAAVALAAQLADHGLFLAGLAAVLGHIFPVWLKFKGGKGVATAIGVMLALNHLLGVMIIAAWLVVFGISRISSLAALAAFTSNCAAAAIIGYKSDLILMILLTALLCYTHRANIGRLLAGTEPKFGKKP